MLEGIAPHKGWHSRGYLPHFDMPGLYQFITFRLADSLPVSYSRQLHAAAQISSDAYHQELDDLLDANLGNCILRETRAAELVQNALLHFDAERYCLLAWVIMPNHVHTVIQVLPGYGLGQIIKSWKAYTANWINKQFGTSGAVWQPDYFDRVMRSEEHFHRTVAYIEYNPVKAGLVRRAQDWPYGSASARAERAS
jgi:putative transposase